jgi:hypothetical protein
VNGNYQNIFSVLPSMVKPAKTTHSLNVKLTEILIKYKQET